jgi:hypothetical protein
MDMEGGKKNPMIDDVVQIDGILHLRRFFLGLPISSQSGDPQTTL